MLTNGHAIRFNIDMWESKIVKKLIANANHYPTKVLRMAYIDSHMNREAYKYLAARSKIGAQRLFVIAKEMFEVLQKAYGDVNWAYTAMNKFQNLKIMKDFNSFWAKFQVLTSELDHNEATLISKLKYKLTLLLSWAMADSVFWPKNLHEYAQQCQLAYQDLKDIKLRTPVVNFGGNQYWGSNTNTNTSTSMSTKTTGQQVNCNKCPTNSMYSHPPSMALNLTFTCLTCSEATRLTQEKIAKLQRKDHCFTCKKVNDYRTKYPNR